LTTTEPTVVDGNELGRIDFQAPLDTGGTDAILVAASIYAEADDTFAADNNSTELCFAVGASETAAEKMRLDHDGQLGIGVATPASLLHVAGTVQVGVDDTGHDVKFFGATATNGYMLWDESTDDLILGNSSNLGIGTTSPRDKLDVAGAGIRLDNAQGLRWGADKAGIFANGEASGGFMRFVVDDVERVRIIENGKVGIGTTVPAVALEVALTGAEEQLRVRNPNTGAGQHTYLCVVPSSASGSAYLKLADNDDTFVSYIWQEYSTGELRFSTNGTAVRMILTTAGYLGLKNTTNGVNSSLGSSIYHQFSIDSTDSDRGVLYGGCNHASLGAQMLHLNATGRSASTGFEFIRCVTDGDDDLQFYVRGDGYVASDGGSNFSGADYAEFFEWADGNPSSEDRTGYSVVFDDTTSNQIRKATSDDATTALLGVVSAVPAVVGDSDMDVKYVHRFQKDDYNRWITEEHTVTEWTNSKGDLEAYQTDRIPDDVTPPSDAKILTTELDGTNYKRKVEDDDYDKSLTYTPRSKRKEWDTIGLMGKLRMKKGQPTGDRWVKMRAISSSVEEWLVR